MRAKLPQPARKRKAPSPRSNKMNKTPPQPSTSALHRENATNSTILNVSSRINFAGNSQTTLVRRSRISAPWWSNSGVRRITATNATGWTRNRPSWRPIAVYDAVGVTMTNAKIRSSSWDSATSITTSVLPISLRKKRRNNSLNRSSSSGPIRRID